MRAAVEGGGEEVVILAEGQGPAVRRQLILRHHLALGVIAPVAAVEIDADQLVLLLLVHLDEHPVRGRAELGVGAVGEDAGRGAAIGRHAEDAGVRGPAVGGQALAAARIIDDHAAVRREARAAVMARLLRHRAQIGAVGIDRPDFAEALVVPRDEGDPAAVARPGREELEVAVVGGQSPRRAVRTGVADPEAPERFEHDLAPVRRDGREARHAGGDRRGRSGPGGAGRIDDDAIVIHPERDFRAARAVAVDPLDMAARPEDDGVGIRRPGHVRIDAVHRPGLLQILVEIGIDLPLLARAQIANEQA